MHHLSPHTHSPTNFFEFPAANENEVGKFNVNLNVTPTPSCKWVMALDVRQWGRVQWGDVCKRLKK